MRVLLTRPPGPTHYLVPPLGLLYVAAALRRAGHDVALHDPWIEPNGLRGLERLLQSLRPDVLGVSAHSSEYAAAIALARRAAEVSPGTVRVLGGAHVSAAPESVARGDSAYTYGIVGEGERPLVDLLACLDRGLPPVDVPGVVSIGAPAGAAIARWRPDDLDALAPPAWDLASPRRYRGAPQGLVFRRWPVAPILTSRGCPYHCAFCSGAQVMGHRHRTRSAAGIAAEVRELVNEHGVRELHVVDDSFTSDRAHARAVCEALAPFGLPVSFPNGLRLDTLDDETLGWLKAAGTYSLNLGIESGSQAVLDRFRKGLRLADVRDAVARIHAVGIEVGAFFILGLPGESRDDLRRTIRFAREIPFDRAHFSNFLPLPGTEATLALSPAATAGLTPEALSYFETPYAPEGLSKPELKRLQREAYLRFYLRPRALVGVLRLLRSPTHARFLAARAFSYLGVRGRHA